VSDSLRRGTSLDALIPAQTKLAVQWLERNYTFLYMEVFRLLQIGADDRIIPLPPSVAIKSIKFIRTIGTDGAYQYLKRIQPEDLLGLRSATTTPAGNDNVPRAFFMVGVNQLVLDAVPSESYNGEAIFREYTDWPTDTASKHPLLQMASDVLLAQTQWFMAVNVMKDLRMAEVYKVARDEGVNTLTRAEDESAYGGADNQMVYAPFTA
jgi:hypothetical protein